MHQGAILAYLPLGSGETWLFRLYVGSFLNEVSPAALSDHLLLNHWKLILEYKNKLIFQLSETFCDTAITFKRLWHFPRLKSLEMKERKKILHYHSTNDEILLKVSDTGIDAFTPFSR